MRLQRSHFVAFTFSGTILPRLRVMLTSLWPRNRHTSHLKDDGMAKTFLLLKFAESGSVT